MPDEPISGLPAGTLPLSGMEPVPCVQAGRTVQVPSGAFAVPVASVSFPDQFADLGPVALYTPENEGTFLLCTLMYTVDAALGAGTVDLTFTWDDPVGAREYGPGGVDLTGDSLLPDTNVLRVAAGSTIDFEAAIAGLYKSAGYSLFVVLLQLQ